MLTELQRHAVKPLTTRREASWMRAANKPLDEEADGGRADGKKKPISFMIQHKEHAGRIRYSKMQQIKSNDRSRGRSHTKSGRSLCLAILTNDIKGGNFYYHAGYFFMHASCNSRTKLVFFFAIMTIRGS